jgi:hypothetical protein
VLAGCNSIWRHTRAVKTRNQPERRNVERTLLLLLLPNRNRLFWFHPMCCIASSPWPRVTNATKPGCSNAFESTKRRYQTSRAVLTDILPLGSSASQPSRTRPVRPYRQSTTRYRGGGWRRSRRIWFDGSYHRLTIYVSHGAPQCHRLAPIRHIRPLVQVTTSSLSARMVLSGYFDNFPYTRSIVVLASSTVCVTVIFSI